MLCCSFGDRYRADRKLCQHPPPKRELREADRLFTEIGAPMRAAEVAKELGL
jgi:hypothetical protein